MFYFRDRQKGAKELKKEKTLVRKPKTKAKLGLSFSSLARSER